MERQLKPTKEQIKEMCKMAAEQTEELTDYEEQIAQIYIKRHEVLT